MRDLLQLNLREFQILIRKLVESFETKNETLLSKGLFS
jgi:hypothetical protein